MFEPREVQRFQRELAAMVLRAGRDDPEALAQVIGLLADAQALLPLAVTELRTPSCAPGGTYETAYSWADIGKALGVTRSAAQQRFTR